MYLVADQANLFLCEPVSGVPQPREIVFPPVAVAGVDDGERLVDGALTDGAVVGVFVGLLLEQLVEVATPEEKENGEQDAQPKHRCVTEEPQPCIHVHTSWSRRLWRSMNAPISAAVGVMNHIGKTSV